MPLDPISDFFETLPPPEMPVGTKFVIYFSIVAVILAVLFTWLSTRGRTPSQQATGSQKSSVKLTSEDDKILYTSLELNAFKQMNDDLHDARDAGEVSNSGFLKLNKYFMSQIDILRQTLAELDADERPLSSVGFEEDEYEDEELIPQAMQSSAPITAAIDDEDEELDDITKDLESRLSGSDDFLGRKPKTLPGFQGGEIEAVVKAQPKPAAPTPPPIQTAPANIQRPAPMPAPTPPVAPPMSQPVVKKEVKPNIPKPEMPKPSIPAPTQATPSSAPKPPVSTNPFQSVNPMEKQETEEAGSFTKSTSIAALRSDMLRELARLKKYIDEGEE